VAEEGCSRRGLRRIVSLPPSNRFTGVADPHQRPAGSPSVLPFHRSPPGQGCKTQLPPLRIPRARLGERCLATGRLRLCGIESLPQRNDVSTKPTSQPGERPLTIRVSNEDLVFRLVHNPIVNPLCGFPSPSPAGVERVDFSELGGEEEACGAGADDEDVYF
jgi:hypothetical protein